MTSDLMTFHAQLNQGTTPSNQGEEQETGHKLHKDKTIITNNRIVFINTINLYQLNAVYSNECALISHQGALIFNAGSLKEPRKNHTKLIEITMNSQLTERYIKAEGSPSFAWAVFTDEPNGEYPDTVIDFLAWHGELYGILEGNASFPDESQPE